MKNTHCCQCGRPRGIENIAKAFALPEAKYHQATRPSWQFDVSCDTWTIQKDAPPPWQLILFAAYAKAEMAKRGWVPFCEGSTVCCGIEMHDEYESQANGRERSTTVHEYDPKCPISEAQAVLSCIADALSEMH